MVESGASVPARVTYAGNVEDTLLHYPVGISSEVRVGGNVVRVCACFCAIFVVVQIVSIALTQISFYNMSSQVGELLERIRKMERDGACVIVTWPSL